MKIGIKEDERYPDYSFTDNVECSWMEVEIPDELYHQFRATEKAYNEMQSELQRLFGLQTATEEYRATWSPSGKQQPNTNETTNL